ncbi:MAG: hypothetical protein HYZ29_27580 [Myxococcales bacterium]|nr:hypothetical protein [Myxococcales bacterium]
MPGRRASRRRGCGQPWSRPSPSARNGFTDCKDFTCQISPAVTACPGEKSDAECHDGIDNDGDGKADCADPTCFGSPFTKCP